MKAAEVGTKNRRSLGVGYIGLAHYLAKHKVGYDDHRHGTSSMILQRHSSIIFSRHPTNSLKSKDLVVTLIVQSMLLVFCLSIHTKKMLMTLFQTLRYDWESLRESIATHGLRNSTLSAQMPSESSSVVSNATNGIEKEAPRGYLSVKKSKGPLKQIVPQYNTHKSHYTLLWDMRRMMVILRSLR